MTGSSRPTRAVALAALAAAAAAGCGRSAGPQPPASVRASGATASTAASSTQAPAVPNPFTITARYSATSLGLDRPANLAIGPDGNLYVTDAAQHVTVISPDGTVLRRWGEPGKGPGQFSFVKQEAGVPEVTAAIAVGKDGTVYVADSENHRIETFSPAGTFIRQFGAFGGGKGQFLFPEYVAVDGDGNVYVSDTQQETISNFSPAGVFEWRIGGAGETDPNLVGHFHLASVDSHWRLVVANDDRSRILYIDASGNKVDAFGSPDDFRDGSCNLTVDQAGDTFVTSCQEPLLSPHFTEVFDRNHHLVGAWDPSPIGWSPVFGPKGEVFALGEDGSVLRLEVALPGA